VQLLTWEYEYRFIYIIEIYSSELNTPWWQFGI